MRVHNIEILADAVLFKLYQHALKSRERLETGEICSLFAVQVPELFVEKALEDLELAGMIYGSHAPTVASVYEIERPGIKRVQEELSTYSSNIAQLSKLGDDWLLEADGAESGPHAQQQPKFTEFRDALIIALYHKSNEHGLDLYNLKDLADENYIAYREGWIFEFCTFLDENGYGLVAKSMGGDEAQGAKLNASGLEYAEELTAQSEGEAYSDAPSLIPASDRYVEIDDNSPDFKDAKAKVESAAEAIRGYNEPTNYDKEQIVSELTIGQQLFKSVKVRVGAAIAVILAPLFTVYNDTAAVALRPVVEAAIDAVKVWLGL